MTKSVLVTGAARSGTRYVSQLLTASGIDACHECSDRRPPTQRVEVSWLAAHYLDSFDGHVVHLIRDPRKVIASIASNGTFDPGRPFIKWLYEQHPDLYREDPVEAACAYWLRWHDLISARADVRWFVERISRLDIRRLGLVAGYSPSDIDAETALANTATDVNTRGRTPTLDWGDLPAEIARWGTTWGYR